MLAGPRYLDWKHHTLLHLDYFAGMFGILYLLVLFWKMLKEPTTLFYVLHIIAKMSPQVPLLLGLRESYLRCVAMQQANVLRPLGDIAGLCRF